MILCAKPTPPLLIGRHTNRKPDAGGRNGDGDVRASSRVGCGANGREGWRPGRRGPTLASMPSRERLRASDRDRDEVVERLREAAAEGRLTVYELDARLTHAFSAATYGELDTLTDDLPARIPTPPASRLTRAGWWRRAGAWMLDGIVAGLITGVLSAVLHDVGSSLGVLVSIAYFVLFEGGPQGAGAGKQAMRIRVVDAQTNAPIGYRRAFVRWLGRILSALVFLLGYFWMLWDADKQCWHDKLASDVVVFSDGRTEVEHGRRLDQLGRSVGKRTDSRSL